MTPGPAERPRARDVRWQSGEAPHLANRVVRAGIGAALLAGVRRRDPSVVANAAVSAVFTALPRVLEVRYGARFEPWQRLWVSAAGLVHTLGMLGPYDEVWWWDHLAHTLSGVVVAAAADVVFRGTAVDADAFSRHSGTRVGVIVGVTIGFGVVWEVLEYVVHRVADRLGFEPLLVHYGRLDALGDLFFDLVGAGIVVRFGRRALSNVVASIRDA